jgi:hypothetical protein
MHIEPEKHNSTLGVCMWFRISNVFLHVAHLINRNQKEVRQQSTRSSPKEMAPNAKCSKKKKLPAQRK